LSVYVDLVFKELEVLITLCIPNDYIIYMDKKSCNKTRVT
jgi:hypothetical protein